MKKGHRIGLRDKYLSPILILALLFISCLVRGQSVYRPSNSGYFTPSNKPYAPATPIPTDGRTYKLDSVNGLFRPYNGTAEVLTYLPTGSQYRVGQFPIIINVGGSLQSNGTFVGGQIQVYWFLRGQADSNLVRMDSTSSGTCSGCLLKENNLSDVQSLLTTLINLNLNNVDNTSDATKWSETATLTNKSISGLTNTFSNIPNSALLNNAIGLTLNNTGTSPSVTTSPAQLGTSLVISIPNSNGSNDGFLLHGDWTKFTAKVDSTSQSNDSVYDWHNGTPSFRYVIVGGSGGIASLNGLTTSTQTFATGTTGSDFNIVSSVSTHTFNFPNSSASNRGLLTSTDWSTFNGKQNAIAPSNTADQYWNGYENFVSLNTDSITEGTNHQFYTNARARAAISLTTTGSSGAATYNNSTGVLNIPNYTGGSGTDTTTLVTSPLQRSSVGTILTLSIQQGTTSQSGYISSTDWNTFNGKQNAITANGILFGNGSSVAAATISSPLTYSAGTLGIQAGGTSQNGYISSTDWNTFNAKQSSLSNTPSGGFPLFNLNASAIRELFAGTGTTIDSTTNPGGYTISSTGGGGGIGGSISSTQVAFGTASNTIGGASRFTFNSSTNTLSSDSANIMRLQTTSAIFNNTPFGAVSSLSWFGNSYDAGYRPCGGATTYVTLSAASWGLSGSLTNYSLSSSGSWYTVQQINQHYTTNVTSASAVGAIGFNDARSMGFSNTAGYNMISGCYNAIFAAHFAGTISPAGTGSSGVTTSGAWTNFNTGQWGGKGSGTGGIYTNSNGSSITYTFTDSSAIVSLIGMSVNGALFQAKLDGNEVTNSTTQGKASGVADGNGNPDTHVPYVIMFTGLSFSSHTLTITNIDPTTTDTLYVDYFGRLRSAAAATPLILLKPNLMDVTGAAIGGSAPYVNAAIRKVSRMMDSVFQTWNQNYPFYVIPTALDTLYGICSTDHIHPNGQGDTAEWKKIISIVPSLTTPTPWTQFYQGVKRQNVNQNGWIRQSPLYDETVKYGDENKYFQNTPYMQTGSFFLNGLIQYQDGNQGANKILGSDANGNAHWITPGTGSPGGPTTAIQISNGSSFSGFSQFEYDSVNYELLLNGGYVVLSAANSSNANIGFNFKGTTSAQTYINSSFGAGKFLVVSNGQMELLNAPSGTAGGNITWNQAIWFGTVGNTQFGSAITGTPKSWVDFPASSTGNASMFITPGSVPTGAAAVGRVYSSTDGHLHWDNGSGFINLDLSGGTANQLTYWNGANSVGSYAYGYVDPTNKKVGFGSAITSTITGDMQLRTNANSLAEFRVQNDDAATAAGAMFQSVNDAGKVNQSRMLSSAFTTSGMFIANGAINYTTATGGLSIDVDGGSSAPLMLGTNNTERARFVGGGNFLVGTITDNNGFFQIAANTTTNAQLFLNGSTADVTSPTNGMMWYNSTTHALNFRDNGVTTNLLSGGGSSTTFQLALTNGSTLTGTNNVTNTAQTFTWTNGGTGLWKWSGNSQDTTNTVGVNVIANDSSQRMIPYAKFAAKIGNYLPVDTLKASNGLTITGPVPGTDTVQLGGTLAQNTTIAGGGGKTLTFGTSADSLGRVTLYSNGGFFLQTSLNQNVSNVGDANYTILNNDALIQGSGSLTANRTITIPPANLNAGRTLIFCNQNATSFSYLISGNLFTPDNVQITKFNNGVTYVFESHGGGNWWLVSPITSLKYQHTIFTPTTGGTVALVNNQYNIINPSGSLATLTVNLPSSPANNDVVYIKYTQSVTTVTYGNGTVVDGITTPSVGGLVVLTYDASTTSWY